MPDSIEDDKTPAADPYKAEAQKAFEARDKAKGELKDAKAHAASLESELATYKAKEAELEADRMRAEGKFDELTAEMKADFAKQLADRDAEIAKRDTAIAKREKDERTGALIEAIQGKASIQTPILKGLLHVIESQGTDVAPERLDPDTITDVVTRLQDLAPEAFKKQDMGTPPGSAGGQESDVDRVKRIMKGISPQRILDRRFS